VTLRAATPLDATRIATLWNVMIRDSLATFTTVEKSVAEVEQMIADRPGAFWVAGRDVQGFVTFGPFRNGPGYASTVEHSIVIAPEAQGCGLGRDLMTQALTGAAARGHHAMIAAISGANPGAVFFHEMLGFDRVGHLPQVGRKSGQWLDLILMQKNLSTP
tara:strand:- start:29515 stop:29997 length:483 start_codon:yes stop_codon:yes gene_type:complete